MQMYGESENGWIVVPPAYDEHGTTFGPFTRDEAKKFMARHGYGDYAVNLADHPDWFNVGPRPY